MAARAELQLPLKINFYGFINAEVEWARALGGATPFPARMRVADGNSRLGLFGSYPLTPNLDVAVQLEGFLNNFEQGGVNDLGQSSTLESRNSYVGLFHKQFGSLLVGNVDNAYRALVGTGSNFGGNIGLTDFGLDLWNNTTAAVSGGFANLFGRGEARLPNSIHYRSPELFGVLLAASYGFDELETQGGRRDHASLGALYSFHGFRIGVGWDHQANTGVNDAALVQGEGFQLAPVNDVSTNYYKVMASYLAPTGTYFGVGYERSVYGFSQFIPPAPGSTLSPLVTGNMSQGGFMASIAQSLGDLALMASFGKLGPLSDSIFGNGADYQATQFSVGAKYAFNASFMAYAYFTRVNNDALQNINLGVPIFTNNLGTPSAFLAPGNKPMAGGVGMIARF
jgi:predicted porin